MERPSSSTWLGIILIVVGFLFLFQQLGWFSIGRLFSLLWPLLLIYIGWTLYRQSQEAGTSADGEVLSRSSFFGDFAIASTSKSLRSVKIWSLFGDGKVDLLEAQPTPNATLDVVLLFADLKVEVPEGWWVESNAVMVIGDLKLPPLPRRRAHNPRLPSPSPAFRSSVTSRLGRVLWRRHRRQPLPADEDGKARPSRFVWKTAASSFSSLTLPTASAHRSYKERLAGAD